MTPVLLAMTLAAALSIHWVADQWDCLFVSAGTDTCVGCTDDCLEPMEEQE